MHNGGREALSFHATPAQRTMRMGQAAALSGAAAAASATCTAAGAMEQSGRRGRPRQTCGMGCAAGDAGGDTKKSRPTGDEPGGRQHERRRHPTLPHCSAVPSAQPGLTSLFGMGRGGTPAQWPPVFSFAWPMAACVAHSTQESNLPAGTQRAPGKEPRVETFGQLVALGFGVAAFTPAPYQRRSLRRPSRSPNLADGFALRCFQRLS